MKTRELPPKKRGGLHGRRKPSSWSFGRRMPPREEWWKYPNDLLDDWRGMMRRPR